MSDDENGGKEPATRFKRPRLRRVSGGYVVSWPMGGEQTAAQRLDGVTQAGLVFDGLNYYVWGRTATSFLLLSEFDNHAQSRLCVTAVGPQEEFAGIARFSDGHSYWVNLYTRLMSDTAGSAEEIQRELWRRQVAD